MSQNLPQICTASALANMRLRRCRTDFRKDDIIFKSCIKILDNFFGVNKEKNKEVLQKHNETVSTYFKSIDPRYLNIDAYYYNNEVCEQCNEGELIPIEYEGIMVCNKCFRNTPYIFQKEIFTYLLDFKCKREAPQQEVVVKSSSSHSSKAHRIEIDPKGPKSHFRKHGFLTFPSLVSLLIQSLNRFHH